MATHWQIESRTDNADHLLRGLDETQGARDDGLEHGAAVVVQQVHFVQNEQTHLQHDSTVETTSKLVFEPARTRIEDATSRAVEAQAGTATGTCIAREEESGPPLVPLPPTEPLRVTTSHFSGVTTSIDVASISARDRFVSPVISRTCNTHLAPLYPFPLPNTRLDAFVQVLFKYEEERVP